MNIYLEWGFRETPFGTNALPPDENGESLLIGRKVELERIKRRLSTPPNIVTLEGSNGVGKTSLINIAAYQMYREYLETREGSFFIPCDESFQLTSDKNSEDLIDEVLMSIAQTLIKRGNELKKRGYNLENNKAINNWLNSPQLSSYDGTISILGSGFGGGNSTENNTTAGFLRSGFRIHILNWLKNIFPYNQNGGVICRIDNLELLQTCDNARKQLEQLRDTLFSYEGIRWVLCGSLGVVSGVASTPRLEGRLQEPIELIGIGEDYVSQVLEARIKFYAIDENNCYLPIRINDFEHLYRTLNKNLRNTLSYAHRYCMWIVDEGQKPLTDEEKKNAYYKWLEKQSNKIYDGIKTFIGTKKMDVFKKGILLGGEFSPSNYEDFGFKSLSAMRNHVVELQKYGLVTSSTDDGDKRRKTIQITPKGYLVNYALEKSGKW